MNRVPVLSSNIAEVGYDAETKVLEIMFNRGSVYQYDDVPAFEYTNLVNANSVGQYFNMMIKNQYKFRKI
jgi:hypothetical protein